MMLAARELNIGSVMVGLFDPRIIRKEFNIPEYIEPTALLILGYPAKGFLSPNRHRQREDRLKIPLCMRTIAKGPVMLLGYFFSVISEPLSCLTIGLFEKMWERVNGPIQFLHQHPRRYQLTLLEQTPKNDKYLPKGFLLNKWLRNELSRNSNSP
jgi:hypothetical protein